MGKFTLWGHTKHFHSTRVRYVTQNNLHHSDWLKSAPHVAQNSWGTAGTYTLL